MTKSKPIDVGLELAEDEYELNLTQQALILQSQAVQEALTKLSAKIDATQGTIAPTVEKVVNDLLKPLVEGRPNIPIPSASGGGILNALPDLMKMFGIGTQTPNQAIIFDLQSQFEAMTAQLWKLQLRKMKDQLGIPEHIPFEGMHLNK
jgi:hypothetical protein